VTAIEELGHRLRAVLAPALGLDAEHITVENLNPFRRTGNRVSWAFEVVTPYSRNALILHLGDSNPTRASPQLQARAQIAAAAKGAPVPRVVAAEDDAGQLGGPFMITDMVKGEAGQVEVFRQLDGADPQASRARLLRQCARALAAIHMVDTQSPEGAHANRLQGCRRALDTPGYAIERELLEESPAQADTRSALADLGFSDEAQLTVAIRDGELDDRTDDVASCLRTLVNGRLAIVHPGYQDE
jgi:Domain of unknown function (DUF6285)/Phosphotransferase enzyme family